MIILAPTEIKVLDENHCNYDCQYMKRRYKKYLCKLEINRPMQLLTFNSLQSKYYRTDYCINCIGLEK